MYLKKILLLSLMAILFIACEEKVERNPELAAELSKEGAELLQDNNFDEAILKFEEALIADDSNADANASLIQIYLYNEQYDKAQEQTEKSIKVLPEVGENWVLGGIFHDKKGNPDKAKDYYLTSIQKFEAAKKKADEEKEEDELDFLNSQITPEDVNIIFSYILLDDRDKVENLVAELQEKDPSNPMLEQLLSFDRAMYLENTFPTME